MQLEKGLVYGPVYSRRFRWDLGINLLPLDRKLCTFNCLYCQYGSTLPFRNDGFRFPSATQIILEWCRKLDQCEANGIAIRHTTISGNGEPTMHPRFSSILSRLVRWRDQNVPQIKLALLTNGYRIHDPAVREALCLVEEPILKLDSAVAEQLREINRPLFPFALQQYIQDLKKCRRFIIQTMFLKGYNDTADDLDRWRQTLREIKPKEAKNITVTR